MGNLNCLGGCLIQKVRSDTPQMSRTSRTSWMKRVCCWPHNRVHPLTDSTEELPEDQLEELSISTLEEEALPNSTACEQASEHAPQEHLVLELPQARAEDLPLPPLEAAGAANEHAPQEHLVLELSQARAEEPPLCPLEAAGAANEHAPQEHLVLDLPQAGAEEPPLHPLEAAGAANEHVPQEDMVVELPQDWAEDEPLRTVDESGEACEHGKYSGIIILLRDNPTDKAPQEHLVVELPQAEAEESPLRPLEAAGAANEHDFTEDLPVNPPCDNTEETQCFSKVALSGCESDCFVENLGSNDAEENAATPDECCPQTPRNCIVHIKDLEESKTIEIPKRYLVIFLKTASGEVSSDDEEDLEEQE
ncbi:uncharacterized protein LOC133227550 isoform X4 [Bos javanicus]|uniref:uncharacterized protein LOC133227550 isoform X4 n=1 Tax=Bos javanicus TaxID=9906 RepID=UPI002AA731F9|nr:uncharacterized protein LOC133227550 isoform X4 [Bos javanicus]